MDKNPTARIDRTDLPGHDLTVGRTTRRSFAKIEEVLPMPSLVEVQKDSYRWFIGDDKTRGEGLMEVLRDVSPITDYANNVKIDFVDYRLDKSKIKYGEWEAKERAANYAAPLRATVRLTRRPAKEEEGDAPEIIEKEVFVCEFPVMTENGTFIINGAERVIVSQIVRAPGMYYDQEEDKNGNKIFTAQIIPYRGAWLEYETDAAGTLQVRIDKNRKIPVTILLRALNYKTEQDGDEELLAAFGGDKLIEATLKGDGMNKAASDNGTRPAEEALKRIYTLLRPGDPPLIEPAMTLLNNLFFDAKRYDLAPVGRYKYNKKSAIAPRIAGRRLAAPLVSELTGEVLAEAGATLSLAEAERAEMWGATEAVVYLGEGKEGEGETCKILGNKMVNPYVLLDPEALTPRSDPAYDPNRPRRFDLRKIGIPDEDMPQVPASVRRAEDDPPAGYPYHVRVSLAVLQELISTVGLEDEQAFLDAASARRKDLLPKHITREDIIASVNYIVGLCHGIGKKDDIDHLGNRRLRTVGELLQNQVRIGFARLEKNVRERMTIQDAHTLESSTLINTHPVQSAVREFFASSPLSQFMDQNNPLAELTHKRRVSALGPGGLSRDRASFEVRDVHYTHYGRMCPVETPEGPNIGLISYLATYAHINSYGFIEAPYRRIEHTESGETLVTDDIRYMPADEEDRYTIAQANEPLLPAGEHRWRFAGSRVTVRQKEEITQVDPSRADYMDVSPRMVVSVATATIPFLDHDDNSRALMGSNMQKQAVPLMVTEAPIVATGMEQKAAVDSGVTVLARRAGVVTRASGKEILISPDEGEGNDEYTLLKFRRSNQGTCINQHPIVSVGDHVEAGEVIADGPATCEGELALGKNALIGFMSWEGYNYEDAVLLSERLVRDDTYTSIHIAEFSLEARETKLGAEEITRDIPGVGDHALRNLDENGLVRVGTYVRTGDILVGKTTPKGEPDLTPEERLLYAIFGKKAREVRDTSMKLRNGEEGVVVGTRTFSREAGDELPAGMIKRVKVYVAQKRKISVGDKMAGRHGNKGVVSRILPQEDMPFLEDGTPLDIVLNPLGVPSRMNIGQVLEVELGMAAKKLGLKVVTPVFDGADDNDLKVLMEKANLTREVRAGESIAAGKNYYILESGAESGEERLIEQTRESGESEEAYRARLESLRERGGLRVADGKATVYDGRTGEPFDNPVTVGIMYYLKLHHLVDDKIHARSTGPYSLVTQQPLGGKAQLGGQRFGEMEVWALEAYGAAYTLQEILTVKSDDIMGRARAYEAIVNGENLEEPGIPESFKVLLQELRALCLNVEVRDKNGEAVDLGSVEDEELPAFRAIERRGAAYGSSSGFGGESERASGGYTDLSGEFDDEEEGSFDEGGAGFDALLSALSGEGDEGADDDEDEGESSEGDSDDALAQALRSAGPARSAPAAPAAGNPSPTDILEEGEIDPDDIVPFDEEESYAEGGTVAGFEGELDPDDNSDSEDEDPLE